MKILFLHGWQSTPGGLKPTYLKDHGHTVLNPALPDDDFDAAVRIAQAEYDQAQPDVVVGSSRGGAVAMNIDSKDTPLEWMYRYARQARLVDGASEIHKMVLARTFLTERQDFWGWP